MNKLKEFIKLVTHQGVKHTTDKEKSASIILFNQICLVTSFFLFGLFFSLMKFSNGIISTSQFLSFLLCFSVPLFNRYGYYEFIKYFLLFVVCANNFLITSVLGYESGRYLLIIPVLLAVFLIWQNESKTKLIIALSIPLSSIVALHFTHYSLLLDKTIPDFDLKGIHDKHYLVSIIIICVIMFFYVFIMNKKTMTIKNAREELETIFNNSFDAFFLVDIDTHSILKCNKRALLMFEAENEDQLIGKRGRDFHRYSVEAVQNSGFINTVKKGEVFSMEMEYITLHGKTFWGDLAIARIDDIKNEKVYLVRISDITGKKNTELQKEALTAELIRHNQNLEQYSYITSHNLRAPVASMAGALQIFNRNNLSDPVNEKVLDILKKSVQNLDTMMWDLNQLLSVKQHTNEIKTEVNFKDTLGDVLISLDSVIKSTNASIEYDFEKGPLVLTIKTYMYSIMLNLVGNAVKYRSPDRKPVIKISTERKDHRILLTIADNGLGFDTEKNKDKLFGLYKRFHNHVEGRGMGLHMVKVQTEVIGGEIGVESKVNVGTIFRISFPV